MSGLISPSNLLKADEDFLFIYFSSQRTGQKIQELLFKYGMAQRLASVDLGARAGQDRALVSEGLRLNGILAFRCHSHIHPTFLGDQK